MQISETTLISRANLLRWLKAPAVPKYPDFPSPVKHKQRYYWTTQAVREWLETRELLYGEHVPEIPADLPAYQPQQGPIVSGMASRIIKKFGGPYKLAAVLKRIDRPYSPVTIYQWTYGRGKGGRGGVIPPRALKDVLAAANAEGILLTPEDVAR